MKLGLKYYMQDVKFFEDEPCDEEQIREYISYWAEDVKGIARKCPIFPIVMPKDDTELVVLSAEIL